MSDHHGTTMARIGMTSGVWDLLHRGHLNLLWRSKQLCDILIVGVVSDAGCFDYKGHYPVWNSAQRERAIRQLGFVDVVIAQRGTDPTEHLERFQPSIFTHGDDWERLKEGHETIDRLGIQFIKLPYTPGVSSTELRAELLRSVA